MGAICGFQGKRKRLCAKIAFRGRRFLAAAHLKPGCASCFPAQRTRALQKKRVFKTPEIFGLACRTPIDFLCGIE